MGGRAAQVVKSNVHSSVSCPQSHGTPSARAVGTVGFEASRQQRVRRPGRVAAAREVAHMIRKLRRLVRDDAGMTTAEYAVGTIAAVAFAAVLYKVVQSGVVQSALTAIIQSALHTL